ncbi:MAG TPA: alkaline phosphatase family protein [Marmoricola sp.]|nr:alkaline phosphatase family protein [Marmoricola sp.]
MAALLAGVLSAPVATASTSPGPVHRAPAPDRFVVAISVDGLNPGALRELGPELTPSFHRLVDRGAGTLNARTAVEMTVTLPNHTGMLTGRRISTVTGHHITFNTDSRQTDVHTQSGAYRASLFDVVHDRGGRTALYTMKDKFAMFDRSWGPELGAPDRVGKDDGRDKIDRFVLGSAGTVTGKVVRQLRRNPFEASFVHLSLPDHAGHEHGFMGPEYLAAVEETDRHLGRILDAVRSTRYLRRHVDVVLTADHGGRGQHHGKASDPDNYTVPFFVWGVDVEPGADLYDLNPERVDPGTGRPGYHLDPPIRNTDLASLVTTLLGHRAVPGGVLPGTQPLLVR